MRRVLTGLGLLLPLALTACGTTVPLSQQVNGSATGLDGSTTGSVVDGSTGGGSTGGGTIGLGSTGTSALGGTSGGTGSGGTGGSTGTTGGSGTGALPAAPTSTGSVGTARGVTPTTIKLGAAVVTGTEGLANAFGVSGGTGAPAGDVLKTLVQELNAKGGILGRKVELYLHEVDAASAVANPTRTYAEICSDFRDDHKVFAVLMGLPPDPAVRKCLAAMGSPLLVTGSFSVMPRAAFAERGGSYMYGINSLTVERLATLFIDSLVQRDFQQKWNTTTGGPGGVQAVKLGLIHADSPDQNALYAAYARELKKHGLTFASTVVYPNQASNALAATQNAVLKFQSEGITHVFGASAFFLKAAENQNYRPRYAYLPGLGKLGADNVPPAQMRGALTVGWTPTTDVGAGEDPGDTPQAKQCRETFRKRGYDVQNRVNQATMYASCDTLGAFRAALTASAVPTVAGLREGYESLGSSFAVAYTFRAILSAAEHNGVNTVRDMFYDSACSCLKYASRVDRR